MLSVHNLSIQFTRYDGGWRRKIIQPVRDLSLDLDAGSILAVVGSSGSGKSLLAHALLGLLPSNAQTDGTILYQKEQVTLKRAKKLRGRELALIPQSVAYLNPLSRVGKQVYRASRLSGQCRDSACKNRDQAFSRYGLGKEVAPMYPFQVSGGMARRVLTATATAGDASLLIADEPTTGLDADAAIQTLHHLRELADGGKGVILITHDLESAVDIADNVAVIYAGTTVEVAPAAHFRDGTTMHPYTKALWNALPRNGFQYLSGNQPSEDDIISGCIFHDRCPNRQPSCETNAPSLHKTGATQVRCFHA